MKSVRHGSLERHTSIFKTKGHFPMSEGSLWKPDFIKLGLIRWFLEEEKKLNFEKKRMKKSVNLEKKKVCILKKRCEFWEKKKEKECKFWKKTWIISLSKVQNKVPYVAISSFKSVISYSKIVFFFNSKKHVFPIEKFPVSIYKQWIFTFKVKFSIIKLQYLIQKVWFQF